ncbi:hypothetical protein SAMN02745126_04331 [Enhydrobacter aerosaccus]|uniref:Uncharacterized protein n=1 Tax=Enhydrobacter aerosaccus TaxID=225324 RepID=A0A1T4S366_9HYPH|nr:hypothetical protein SAMN02745126_04331 [Enhydrobacter aerosaccus]
MDFPYGSSHIFAVYRKGELIGHHALRFRHEDGKQYVATSLDLAVKALGVTLFRYNYRCHEVWEGSTFLRLESEANDNGTKYAVKAEHSASAVAVDRLEPAASSPGGQESVQPATEVRDKLPAGILPSTHWNRLQVEQSALLNTQYGTISKIKVSVVGQEAVKTVTHTLTATRYDYTGDLRFSQWFDDRNRWVKASFPAPDGSIIDYILQE